MDENTLRQILMMLTKKIDILEKQVGLNSATIMSALKIIGRGNANQQEMDKLMIMLSNIVGLGENLDGKTAGDFATKMKDLVVGQQ